jgi:hypothetical protein
MSVPIIGDDKDGTRPSLEKLKDMAWTLAIVSGLLFYSGYYTLSTFYGQFDTPLWLLDFPAYMFPLNAHVLIIRGLIAVLAFIPLTWCLVRFDRWWYSRKGITRPLKKSLPVSWIVYFAAFGLVVFSFFSWSSGTDKALEFVRNNSAVITLSFKTANPAYPRDEQLLKANQAGTLRMLTQTKELVIVYENSSDNKLTTYVIPRSELSSVRAFDVHPLLGAVY